MNRKDSVTCPLCGYVYEKAGKNPVSKPENNPDNTLRVYEPVFTNRAYTSKSNISNCTRCPMGKGCKVLCCPHCGYQVVDDTFFRDKFDSVRSLLVWVKQKILKMKF